MTKQFAEIQVTSGAKNYTRVSLEPGQASAWEMTRAALLWHFPAFTHILYSMMNPKGNEEIALFTKDIPTLATDGVNLIINPDFFFPLPLSQRIFATAHEIMHNVFDHCGMGYHYRKMGKIITPTGNALPYDHQLMNIAQDLVINDTLIQSKVGEIGKGWLHDTSIAVSGDSCVDVYKKLFEEAKGGGGGDGPGSRNGQHVLDDHLDPGAGSGQDASQAQADRNKAEWDTAVAAAVASAKAQGKMPAALEKLFSEVLEPAVSWTDKVRGFFARKVGGGSYDWRRADRRMIIRDIITPSRSGFGAGLVVIGFDTSGSIYCDPGLLDRFLGEMSGIIADVKPSQLLVMWCDAHVHLVEEVDELTDLKGLRPVGGGGTSFIPVFDKIAEMALRPDAVIYLTDGYGSFPHVAPDYPVLWGDVGGTKYPFGEVVEIPHD